MLTKVKDFFNRIKGNEQLKNRATIVLKIVTVAMFLMAYSILWIQGLYKEKGVTDWKTIIISTLVFIVPSVLLFVKIRFSNIANTITSIAFSIFVIIENYVMLQVSQGYPIILMSKTCLVVNIIVITAIFAFFFMIFNSFKVGIASICITTTVFGLANYYVIKFRGLGLIAADVTNFKTAANVATGYTYELDSGVYMLVITSIAIILLSTKLGENTFTKGPMRIVSTVLALCVIGGTWYIYDSGLERFNKATDVKYFKPQETFKKKGMYATFARSVKDLIVEEPEGYSVDVVKELTSDYIKGNYATNKEGNPNIIVIMDEAFVDFSSLTNLPINEDCLPFYHSLTENTIKGQLFVPVFAGGTASTEFEVITSNSMAFIPSGVAAYAAYIDKPMSSLATTLKKYEYCGIQALHPHKPTGYDRDTTYPLLGFEEFITKKDFTNNEERVHGHISDTEDFKRIIKEYEEFRTESDAPYFMFNVTMQNHSPYEGNLESKGIELMYDKEYPQAEFHANLMKYTDDALKTLITYFENVDEPTMIVFFGDHQPKIEKGFYKKVANDYLLGDEYSSMKKYCSQYFIWTNYDIEEKENFNISSNYLTPLMLDVAGMEMSGYQSYVYDLMQEIPVFTKKGYVGSDGVFYKIEDENSPYYQRIKEYKFIQYNNVFDVKNRIEGFY